MEYKMGEDGTAGVPSSLYSYLFPYLPSLWRWHYWLTLQCFINKLYKFFCIFFCFEGICTISFPFIEKISDFYTTTSNIIETHYTITRFYVRLTAVISMVLRTVKGG